MWRALPRPRLVVTGASGFLGAHLGRMADAGDLEVLLVSRSARANGSGGGKHVRVDDYADTPEGDLLVHLAESNDPSAVSDGGDRHRDESRRVLDALLAKSYDRAVYASSALVYGDAHAHDHREDEPIRATSAYAALKLECETIVTASGGVALRLANVYGPGMNRQNVVSHILEQVGGPGPVTVRDTGPIRDYLWVDDAAAAFLRMANCRESGVFNVGTESSWSVGDISRLMLGVIGEADREVVSTTPSGTPSMIRMDCSKITAACGWKSRINLESGFRMLCGVGSGECVPDRPEDT